MITLDSVYRAVDGAAPFELSARFVQAAGGYDNSGILLRTTKGDSPNADGGGALFALDLTFAALAHAMRMGANVIVTHHPAIWHGFERLDCSDASGTVLLAAAEAGISIVSAHLNADAAAGGVDENLALAAGAKDAKILLPLGDGVGYGRVYSAPCATFGTFTRRLLAALGATRAFVYGAKERRIGRVASFSGAGGKGDDLARAVKAGADVLVSADLPHHALLEAVERGLAVVQPTHYASENYGFRKLYEKIKNELDGQSEYFTDERYL